jgi:intein-encoded DNA endonuclease-like protein
VQEFEQLLAIYYRVIMMKDLVWLLVLELLKLNYCYCYLQLALDSVQILKWSKNIYIRDLQNVEKKVFGNIS